MSFINQQELEEICIFSIEKNNLEKFKQFLSSGFNVNSFLRSRNKIWDSNCFSILAIASFSGALSIVQFLIQKSVNINQTDSLNNRTALHWAVASGHFEIAKLLIEAGAFVNALDRDSISPLMLAVHYGDLNLVKMLIKYGANVNQCDRMNTSVLHHACMRLHTDIVRELITAGCTRNSYTPYSYCSSVKYLILGECYRTAKCLIESGCDLSDDQKWIFDEAFALKKKLDPEFMKWLRSYVKSPPKLMSLCRRSIRSSIGSQCLAEKVKTLFIPKFLEEYLLMKF